MLLDIQTELKEIIEATYFCSCNANFSYLVIKGLLRIAKNNKNCQFYKSPLKMFGALFLDSICLIEHGTGIGSAWITKRGEILLSFLEEYGTDPDKWPDWINE